MIYIKPKKCVKKDGQAILTKALTRIEESL